MEVLQGMRCGPLYSDEDRIVFFIPEIILSLSGYWDDLSGRFIRIHLNLSRSVLNILLMSVESLTQRAEGI